MGLSKFASEGIISRMPENVISNVLDRLPLQEAVRTSILSRNWRFSWTLLTQLAFDEDFFCYLLSKKHVHLFYKRNLGNVLLQLKGSITKFVIYIPSEAEGRLRKRKKEYNRMYAHIVEDINHWILFLSTKGIKEFTLVNMRPDEPVKLPNHLFLCLELKYLKLHNCCLHPVLGLHCFPKLFGFEFHGVTFDSCKYGEFIARCCPLLENLEISSQTQNGEVKLGEIAKLVNLKMLSLKVEMLCDTVVTSSDIIQLVASLPKLEKLKLDFEDCEVDFEEWEVDFEECEMLAKASASERLSANLHCLKTLAIKKMDFKNHILLECAYDLINGLPNLQTLKMTHATLRPIDHSEVPCSIEGNLRGNLQLQYVNFGSLCCEENEVRFIESILAHSPLLKKMVIKDVCDCHFEDDCWSLPTKLLKLHRASPIVEISISTNITCH